MTKHNFYVITGGPGGGKTCLLESLASMGYNYIHDTARQIIKERLAKGLTPRPDPKFRPGNIRQRLYELFYKFSSVIPALF